MTYKEHNIDEIKKHLNRLLEFDYEKLDERSLMTMEHILYYNIIRDLEESGLLAEVPAKSVED